MGRAQYLIYIHLLDKRWYTSRRYHLLSRTEQKGQKVLKETFIMADDAGQQFMISSSREPRLPRQRLLRRSMVIWLTAIFLVETLASGMTWPSLLQRFQALTSGPGFSTRQARGQAFFVSSGLLGSLNSSQGTTDELQINLQGV